MSNQITLDRHQREALRREMSGCANGYGDFEYTIRKGDREAAHRNLKRLRGTIGLPDAIGWSEQPDAPDLQPVTRSRAVAAWARRDARELSSAFTYDFIPDDSDLEALGALVAFGGDA